MVGALAFLVGVFLTLLLTKPGVARTVAVRLRVLSKPATTLGDSKMSLAVSMTNRQFVAFALAPPVNDVDGQPFQNADGSPFSPAVSWAASNPVCSVLEVAPDGLSGVIRSGLNGTSTVTVTVGPYPDGSTLSENINVAVGNSEPGALSVSLGDVQAEA